jgi:hypothetical protein
MRSVTAQASERRLALSLMAPDGARPKSWSQLIPALPRVVFLQVPHPERALGRGQLCGVALYIPPCSIAVHKIDMISAFNTRMSDEGHSRNPVTCVIEIVSGLLAPGAQRVTSLTPIYEG